MVDMTQRSGTAPSGDLEICYDEFGDVDAPPVVLIMGLGAQMVYWREGFCQQIADAGYRVIRFDNRDIGLTTKLDGARVGGPALPLRLGQSAVGRAVAGAPYTLVDMAAMQRRCSTTSGSSARTSWVPRWAA
jgi:pimeloyl-ACP methyl ester carboxylesterase